VIVDFAADEEGLVQIEGIDLMTEYLPVIKKKLVERDYLPSLEKIIKKSHDSAIDDEIRIRLAKLSGKAIDRLSEIHLVSNLD